MTRKNKQSKKGRENRPRKKSKKPVAASAIKLPAVALVAYRQRANGMPVRIGSMSAATAKKHGGNKAILRLAEIQGEQGETPARAIFLYIAAEAKGNALAPVFGLFIQE